MAGGSDKLALRVDLQGAVAGVALPARGLHHEERFAIDGDIERVLGGFGGALRKIVPSGAVGDVADAADSAPEIVLVRGGAGQFLAQRLPGPVAPWVLVPGHAGGHTPLPLQRPPPGNS